MHVIGAPNGTLHVYGAHIPGGGAGLPSFPHHPPRSVVCKKPQPIELMSDPLCQSHHHPLLPSIPKRALLLNGNKMAGKLV